jgi:hypothetical protein
VAVIVRKSDVVRPVRSSLDRVLSVIVAAADPADAREFAPERPPPYEFTTA